MKQRTKMLLAGLTATAMLLCTACGSASSGTTASSTGTPESGSAAASETSGVPQADLLVSVWGGPHADLQKSVVQDYPNGTVTIDDVDYSNLQSKQITSFAAQPGSGNYDVVWIDSNWLQQYVAAGYIQPIDEYVEASGLDTSIYAQGLLEDCKVDGKLYGLPTYAQCLILCYDTEAFEEAGLEVPTNIQELIEVAKYFKEQGTGIAVPAKQGTASINLFSQLLYSDGYSYFNEDGTLSLTSEGCIKAAEYYDQLVQYSVEGSTAWHHDEVAEAVRTKKAPIGIVMSALCNQNYDEDKSLIADTVAYAPLTGEKGEGAALNTFWIWAVASNSANPETAANFCEWMTSPEVEREQTLADQQISAITELSEDPEVVEATPYLPVVMEVFENGKSNPQTAGFATMRTSLEAALSEIATTDADPAQVLEELQEQMKDVDFTK